MSGDDNLLTRWLYPLIASLAGAVTALSFRPFKTMSSVEITLALFVGASFAMFVAPWVTKAVFGEGPIDVRLQGAIFYMMASGSNVLVPVVIKRLRAVSNALLGVKDEDMV